MPAIFVSKFIYLVIVWNAGVSPQYERICRRKRAHHKSKKCGGSCALSFLYRQNSFWGPKNCTYVVRVSIKISSSALCTLLAFITVGFIHFDGDFRALITIKKSPSVPIF